MSPRVPFAEVTTAAAIVLPVLAGGSPAAARLDASERDRTFLIQAHQDDLGGIAAGKLARDRGQDPDVRSIGSTMVADHSELDTVVKSTANALGVSLPSEPSAEQKAGRDRLNGLSGTTFDRAWVEAMIQDHHTALELGAREVQQGSSKQVKDLARSSAPVIRNHLNRLLQAQRRLNAAG
ncbi:DUF4142 domain-containing protein [Sphaerisporangium fuscum]|uniref:DUF4142 domain-containing protein n=1 Tax=Sphaerisporangium fuscum TaxID=2835868 RepID=UPI001BDD5C90|nr:DUF4142 domain-containing protein [Sphaerisporangium fuscum]